MDRSAAKAAERQAEAARRQKEFDRYKKEAEEEYKELRRLHAETQVEIKKATKLVGDNGRSLGKH